MAFGLVNKAMVFQGTKACPGWKIGYRHPPGGGISLRSTKCKGIGMPVPIFPPGVTFAFAGAGKYTLATVADTLAGHGTTLRETLSHA